MIVHSQRVVPQQRTSEETDTSQSSMVVNAKMLTCLLPDFDQVSITVVGDGGCLTTLAQSGDLVQELDTLQYSLGEGPCFDSVRTGHPVTVPLIRRAERWRRYVTAAGALGLRSQIAMPLTWHDEKPLGVLNMYSTTHSQIGISAHVVAEVMATQVVSALVGGREIERLRGALGSRAVIGQATGLVMALLQIDAEAALAYLGRASEDQHEELAGVAAEIVRTRDLPRARPEQVGP